MQAVQSIIEQQKVQYDFGFYKLPQHTDSPVTILSEGRTLLRTAMGLELPLQPTSGLGAHTHRESCCIFVLVLA